ncbi:serine/threonine-protein kinase [Nocardioides sp.]|uniref:serine/threonine-protein kinase n=1 Tax=Nocardioides sp. TaxID=35761 RepID=UPI002736FBDB|nr:serine/threonine-protein kinase [Nocardioides sp.]MDP3889874.1 serine/threonine-protein kinase [Nocardioides sp.]
MTTTPRSQAPAGLKVGDYTLLTRVGEGGMGVVHLAQRPGGERVALKVLRPHIVGDDEARERLAREVNSLSRIRSPRIAEIVDADPWGEIPYVATRYVPGLSLHDHVRTEGPITGEDLRWFAHCLAEALASVHGVGVLHRDIKPSNVLMEGRSPVLIDFGLARLADDPRLTQTGWLLGTPGYLAPEILFGDDATPAADVHSWASTVAYAGTGRSPFGRGPSMAIMDRVRRGEHDLSGLPDDIGRIVHAALDPEPSRRPTLEVLRQWLQPATAAAGATVESDDRFTLPYAVAVQEAAEDPTDLLDDEPDPTRRYTEHQPYAGPDPDHGDQHDDPPTAWLEPQREPYQQPPPPRAAEPWPVRLRRGALVAAGAGAIGAAIAAYPYLALLGLAVVAWLLRSGSLAATAAGDLRRLRGPRWYDGPRLLLAGPWHFVRSIPGTTMLLAWSAGLAVAAGLLCYAAAVGLTGSLFVTGTAFGASMWFGPGGSRIRGPVRRVVDPISRAPWAWVVTVVVVVGIALGVGYVAASDGTSWEPAGSEPLAPGTFLGDLLRR